MSGSNGRRLASNPWKGDGAYCTGQSMKDKSLTLSQHGGKASQVELAMADTREGLSHEEFMSFQDKVMSSSLVWGQGWSLGCAHGDPRPRDSSRAGHLQDAVSARVMATLSTKGGGTHRDPLLTDNATLCGSTVCRHKERDMHHSTWDAFKREIKRQFYPKDVAYLARMKRLKHTGSIREYVKEFSTLMLEIPNMSDEELLFNFMDNLQSWPSKN
ncbi:hypothetical protein CK203_050922 [Vitis vinifera]|uniref:Retrotransposon gag domain-containing protein n=1 Tax=Vitis vinifera TaxID=29760 RepID=A0A438GQW2_VITVI|nr:hypothetical protein CK203_050922 [Vitis vinifera]